jgi:hypothetical protein
MSFWYALFIAALCICVICVSSVSLILIMFHASKPASFERPAHIALRIIDRPLLGLEILLGNAACIVSCVRHSIHAAFRNRETRRAPPTPDSSLSTAARLCAWTGDRSLGRALGADRLSRLISSIQEASMLDPSLSHARVARAIERVASSLSAISGKRLS